MTNAYSIHKPTSSFWVTGAMKEFTATNFSGFKYHVDYNNRLQPVEIWTGASAASNFFDKRYTYDSPGTTHQNNGNIYTITNVKDSTRTQTFTYDVLNRLISAGDQTHWANQYQYDAWGNMQKIKLANVMGENLQIAGDSWNHMTGYSYDAAGNMLQDGVNQWTYVYDSENRVTSAGSTSYTYDADGRRVKKSSGTNYWYGPTGTVLAETDSAGNWTNYIFFGGQRLARHIPQPSPNPPDIKYYVTDHLHSTGIFADKSGTVLDDNDFYPWGGAIPGVGVSSSNNHYKFTGKERDTESQLDYFGARYYSNGLGRFMSADWAAKPVTVPYAKFGDPQSLNLYSYVENEPINRIDADGHSFAGFDGFLAPKGGDVQTFNVSHGSYGVDADYDSTTDLDTGKTTVNKPGTLPQQPPTQTGIASTQTFKTRDAAAKAALKAALDATDKSGRKYEFGGLIIKNKEGLYTYTIAVTFKNGSHFYPESVSVPKGFSRVADYHTHPHNDSAEGEGLSAGDEDHGGWPRLSGVVLSLTKMLGAPSFSGAAALLVCCSCVRKGWDTNYSSTLTGPSSPDQ